MKKLRVALCLSGQMRGYKKAAESIKKYLIDPFDTDVFIHTWSEIGSSVNEHKRTFPMILMHYLPDNILNNRLVFDTLFPKLSMRLVETEMVNEIDLEEIFKPRTMVIEDSPKPDEYDGFFGVSVPEKLSKVQGKAQWSRQLFYKIWKCNELKKIVEAEENFKYDLVIRLRPDLSIGGAIPEEHLNDLGKLYFRIRTVDLSYQVADQYFYGSSEVMDSVCDTFLRIPELWEEYETGERHHKYYWAEGLLYTSISRIGGNMSLIPYRTEAPEQGSAYILHSFSKKRQDYIEVKDDLFSDIESMSEEYAQRITLAASRVLAAHVIGCLRNNDVAQETEMARLFQLVEEFEARTAQKPDYAVSILEFEQGKLKEAEEAAERALAQEPKSNDILRHCAKLANKQGHYSRAVEFATRGIELPDEYKRENRLSKWALYDHLGRAQEELQNHFEALFAYMASFSLNPIRASSAYRCGKMLFRLGMFDQSLGYLRCAQEIDPKHDAAAYFEAHCLCKMGMYLAAQAVVLKFIKNRGDVRGKRTKFLGPLAIVQFGRGQGAEAKKTINAYLTTGVLHHDEITEMTGLLLRMGCLMDARALARRGLAKFPHIKHIQEALAGLFPETPHLVKS